MKNIIIAALGAYIFYGFCVVRSIVIPFIAFGLFWVIVEGIDEEIADFKKSVKRGQELNKAIDRAKRGRRYE